MPEIIFNKELWETGFAHNCLVEGNKLHAGEGALYISVSIDSLESGTRWGRLTLSYPSDADARYSLSYFASDYKTVYSNGDLLDVDNIIGNEAFSAEEKRALLDGIWADATANPTDMPLFKAKGRYFWFMLEFSGQPVALTKLKIQFNQASWTAYLPEIYQSDESSFLNRFLAMLQSPYSDLDNEISDISRILDVGSANSERLLWLAKWVDADRFSGWPEERLKAFIKNARALSGSKGTKECILKAIELYTGERPLIVETFETILYEENKLYGNDINSFTVIVREDCLSGSSSGAGSVDAAGLMRLICCYAPAHAQAKVAVLKPFIVLGLHTYLGINTELSRREAAELNDKVMAPFGVVL